MTTHMTPSPSPAPLWGHERQPVPTAANARRWGAAGAAAPVALDAGVNRGARPTPWDWLFPGFFLCMVVAILPLAGLQWTYPDGAAAWRALSDAMLLSLPLFVPLPLLLAGCLVALAIQPATRTPAAFAFLGAGVLVAAAGALAVLSLL